MKKLLLFNILCASLSLFAADLQQDFYYACSLGPVDKVEELLKAGVDPNAVFKNGSTPLYVATLFIKEDVVRLLLKVGADVNKKNTKDEQESPLHQAMKPIVPLLLEHGANVNSFDKYGNTPLCYAVTFEDLEKAELLLDAGAEVNPISKGNCTPLHDACRFRSKELVELLLKHGANKNLKDRDGKTAFMIAQERGCHEIVELVRGCPDVLPLRVLVLNFIKRDARLRESLKEDIPVGFSMYPEIKLMDVDESVETTKNDVRISLFSIHGTFTDTHQFFTQRIDECWDEF